VTSKDSRGHDHAPAAGHGHRHGHGPAKGGVRGFVGGLLRPHSHDATDSIDHALEASRYGIRAVKISLMALAGTRRFMHAVRLARKTLVSRTGEYQGRFALVRTFVLPSLSTRCSTRSCRTQHDQPSRISLRDPCLVFGRPTLTSSRPADGRRKHSMSPKRELS
jgi:hypothetical protein